MFKDVKQRKKEIREQYRAIRKNTDANYSSYAANFLINLFRYSLNYVRGRTIAAYIPIDQEINVIPLMYNLLNLGYKIAIPDKNKLLRFKEWSKEDKNIVPDAIITPVIAFDDHFNRLGFGSGWYDAVIRELQPLGKIFIGIAYEKQYYKDLPVEKHDQKLDIIVTEVCIRCRHQNFYNHPQSLCFFKDSV
ncbi:5-formyltetrahydrofolate cyclo-ligase [Wolbachia endosymbiont of Cruorifilaria tuberocauda]|uniref:5-formyltetrahydrofolate cyclo-ligase n=1 Tax=Wolbachia endosymbiont of Cruorifilaria tuberocauda TaxID=1812111 RepID=UPI00158C2322|nr:5-formyltetrahydrofolate cyclo-ligase [Wolbachia endosymbiont of Cruorifilaria tuberocauda]QKX01369.1 5-formyltetrahydrofolate cyclo-ligase [Wolbachia endosymbiont of Cruorifilaria tuberocauda]